MKVSHEKLMSDVAGRVSKLEDHHTNMNARRYKTGVPHDTTPIYAYIWSIHREVRWMEWK